MFRFPAPKSTTSTGTATNTKYLGLLWDPEFDLCLINMIIIGWVFGFNEPTLEPYANKFQKTSTATGVLFALQMSSFCCASVLAGVICHYKVQGRFIPVAHGLNLIAYLLIGPAPFIPIEPSLLLIYISQVFIGAGIGMTHILSYCHAVKRAVRKGYPESMATASFVSGCIFTSYMIGAITSPPISGYLVGTFGYRKGSLGLLSILIAWAPLTLTLGKKTWMQRP